MHISISWECDFYKIGLIYKYKLSFWDFKKLKLIRGGHFEFQQKLLKIRCTSSYCEECGCKIWIISDVSLFAPTNVGSWLLSDILKFGSIFKSECQWHRSSSSSWLKIKFLKSARQFYAQARVLSNKLNKIKIG